MNVIREIRNFVRAKIRELNPRINESQNPHNDNTVGQIKLDESYFLRFLSAPIAQRQSFHQYSFPIEIEIIAKAGVNPNEAHDKIMCDAIGLAARLVIGYSSIVDQVRLDSITPEPVQGNERFTRVIINATFITNIKDGIS